MSCLHRLLPACMVLGVMLYADACSSASLKCIEDFFKKAPTLAFSLEDVEHLTVRVAKSIGEDPASIKIMPCDDTFKIESFYQLSAQPGVPVGKYIFYNKNWLRESVGYNWSGPLGEERRRRTVVMIGHELGHLLKGHFTDRKLLSPLEKETEADNFAGCAAAAFGVPWKTAEDVLSSVREDDETSYPARDRSLMIARQGYDRCVGQSTAADSTFRFRHELQQAVIRNSAAEVVGALELGADPNMPLAGNLPAIDYAWRTGKRSAFNQLLLKGGKLGASPQYDGLIVELVRDARTPPDLLRAAIKGGARVRSDEVYGAPACIAVRSAYRQILKEAGYTC